MKQPLRITHVFGSAYAGGWAFHPLKIWHDAGLAVSAICPTEGPLVDRLRAEHIPVAIVPFPRRMRYVRQDLRCITEMAGIFRQLRTTVAHFHLTPANLWGRIAAWHARVPVRLTQWPGPLPLEIPISRRLDLLTVWMDTAVVASCVATQRLFERYWHTRRKVRLIYYGFPFGPFDPAAVDARATREEFHIAPQTSLVGMVAYMSPPRREKMFGGLGIKGHEILLQAAQRIVATGHEVKFLIVGDELIPGAAPVYKPRLQQMALELGLQEQVIFAGLRHDIPRLIAGTDVVAVPSLTENVGGAVEPLLMEIPVVASNVGGLPDVVFDGETGFLVPPRDPAALAAALVRILELPAARRQEMGRRGRAIVQDLFDLQKTTAQTLALYDELLHE